MLSNRSFWIGRHLPLLAPDNDGGGNGSGTEGDPKSGADKATHSASGNPVEPGDDKEALRRMGEQRDAAREESRKATEERDALKAEKEQREADEQKRKDKEAAESGKWEELATKRESDLTNATAEITRLTGENDQLKTAMTEGLATRIKDLPEPVRDALNDTFAEDDVLGRWNWLHKPSVLKLIAEKTETLRGNGKDPKSSGDGTKIGDEVARKANAQRYFA